MRMSKIKTTNELRQVCMQPTPPKSRGMSQSFVVQTCPSFKLWLNENCHHHDMGVKPQALNLTKLFVKSGDNLRTLWETVVVSNENVQEPTNMFGESNSL